MAQNTSLLVDSSILDQATGPVSFKLTNDYLFRAVMQKNENVLKGLVCALLHLQVSKVSSLELRNPIVLGEQIDAKTFIFDLRIHLNGNQLINIELQVANYHDWPERSIGYLSREFDQLKRGEHYIDTLPVHQISILNFTLFDKFPEFYTHYYIMNQKNYQIYSDKFMISVLDLTQIHRATKEDTDWELDYWARFFLAETWEDIKMLAENNENIKEAAVTMYAVSAEENIRLQCEARERYESERKAAIRWGEILGETEGMAKGMAKGMAEGMAEGRSEGLREGIELAKKVFKLNTQGLSMIEIAKECDRSLEEVSAILDE